ncbi:MAG TPA: hypothetical protein VMU77_00830 [Acidimicrobiales bacterium]|nr:hypothetical protein [Acidimicrobiales bacterium]
MADIIEVALVDHKGPDTVLRFDGAVIDVFGYYVNSSVPSARFLARGLTLNLNGPDRKGQYLLIFQASNVYTVSSGPFDDTDLARLEPLIAALQVAGAKVTR